jgi:GcrA cell cycle regulator
MSQGQRDPKWTPEQDLELASQIMDGNSFSVAAAEVNAKFGTSFTRNAAIGRAHRLGLCQPKFVAKKKPEQPAVKPRAKRVVRSNGNSDQRRILECPEADAIPLRCVEIEPLNLPLIDLADDGCRYPYGDGPSFTFCGHPQLEGVSYCAPHWSLTFARARGTNEAATERRRRNFRKQHKIHLLEQQHEEAPNPRTHQSQGRGAEVGLSEIA